MRTLTSLSKTPEEVPGAECGSLDRRLQMWKPTQAQRQAVATALYHCLTEPAYRSDTVPQNYFDLADAALTAVAEAWEQEQAQKHFDDGYEDGLRDSHDGMKVANATIERCANVAVPSMDRFKIRSDDAYVDGYHQGVADKEAAIRALNQQKQEEP